MSNLIKKRYQTTYYSFGICYFGFLSDFIALSNMTLRLIPNVIQLRITVLAIWPALVQVKLKTEILQKQETVLKNGQRFANLQYYS